MRSEIKYNAMLSMVNGLNISSSSRETKNRVKCCNNVGGEKDWSSVWWEPVTLYFAQHLMFAFQNYSMRIGCAYLVCANRFEFSDIVLNYINKVLYSLLIISDFLYLYHVIPKKGQKKIDIWSKYGKTISKTFHFYKFIFLLF